MNERAPMDSEILGGLPGPDSPKGTELSEGKRMNQEVAEAIVQSRLKRGEKVHDVIQGLEEEMEGLEEKMKGKKGTQEWDDYALMLNDKERQLQVAVRISEEPERLKKTQALGGGEGHSGQTTFQTQHATEAAKKRAEAFAWAKARAEEVRASYAKPAVPQPASTGFFSRVTGWFASLGRQREAGKKIAEALTPALRGEPSAEEAQRNAQAYEARVFSKSRSQETKSKDEKDEGIAAK